MCPHAHTPLSPPSLHARPGIPRLTGKEVGLALAPQSSMVRYTKNGAIEGERNLELPIVTERAVEVGGWAAQHRVVRRRKPCCFRL